MDKVINEVYSTTANATKTDEQDHDAVTETLNDDVVPETEIIMTDAATGELLETTTTKLDMMDEYLEVLETGLTATIDNDLSQDASKEKFAAGTDTMYETNTVKKMRAANETETENLAFKNVDMEELALMLEGMVTTEFDKGRGTFDPKVTGNYFLIENGKLGLDTVAAMMGTNNIHNIGNSMTMDKTTGTDSDVVMTGSTLDSAHQDTTSVSHTGSVSGNYFVIKNGHVGNDTAIAMIGIPAIKDVSGNQDNTVTAMNTDSDDIDWDGKDVSTIDKTPVKDVTDE